MTQPKLARRSSTGRVYCWPPEPPHELELPSVTTVLSGGLPKPALVPWAAKMAAECAVDKRDAWQHMERDEAVDWIKQASSRYRDKKGGLGDEAHNAVEAYLFGNEPDVDPAAKGYYQGALAFLRDWQPEVLAVEATVYSRMWGYAGTCDLIVTRLLGSAAEGYAHALEPHVLDWKTAKAIYGENALQLSAYARADFIGHTSGEEEELPEIRRGGIVRLKPAGGYELKFAELTDDEFDTFLAAKAVGSWINERSRRTFEEAA